MQTRHAFKMIDDWPIQILVAKPGENPASWAVPVEWVLTILQSLEALGLSLRVALGESGFQHACLTTP